MTSSSGKLELVRYTEAHAEAWDGFIAKSVNGNFLHTRKFFDHNPLNAQDDHSALFLKKGKPVAVVPAVLLVRDGVPVLHSHARSTYGGFVVGSGIGVEEAMELVELLIAFAKESGAKKIVVRNPFRIFNRQFCDETDYAMWRAGFTLLAREVEIAIDLKPELTAVEKRFENGTKYNIKKAEKIVTAQDSEDYEAFWELLAENLRQRHDTKPVHSLEQFRKLRALVGDECVKLFGGYADGKLVCGVVTFLMNGTVIHAQYIASDAAAQEYRPVNAVLAHIIRWGKEHGYETFNLGTANEDGGRVCNTGLFHFKESFGGRGVLRETMQLILDHEQE